MSKTDQAFIDAYRRRQARQSAPADAPAVDTLVAKRTQTAGTPSAATRVETRVEHEATHGPHVRFGGGAKAPLSQVMQAREAAASTPPAASVSKAEPQRTASETLATEAGVIASTQLTRFAWPETVSELAGEHTDAFATLLEGIEHQWPVLGLASSRPGSGSTTTSMVLARLLAAMGLPVALIDADPQESSLASQLGLMRHQTIATVLSGGVPLSEATVHAVKEGISLLVAGQVTQHPAMLRQTLHELRQTHAAVLIDLGSDPRRVVLPPDAIALVHPAGESEAVLEYSCRSLRLTGASLVGTIETLAPAA